MMEFFNLQSRPPKPLTPEEIEEQRQRFIAGEDITPEEKTAKRPPHEMYPWEASDVRKDVKKLFSLRLSEPDMLKLQYIHQKTGKSMHRICLDAILPHIEQEIRKLTGE